MKNRTLYKAAFVALLLFGLAPTALSSDTIDQLNSLLDKIVQDQVVWGRYVGLLKALTFAVAVIGIVVGGIQLVKLSWAKITGIMLALVSSAIVAFNSTYFSADYRAFERVWTFADGRIYQFRIEIGEFPDPSPEQRAILFKHLRELKSDIDTFAEQTLKNQIPIEKTANVSANFNFLVTEAFADNKVQAPPRVPAWTRTPPSDDRNLYFLGISEDSDFARAKNNAIDNARKIASDAIGASIQKTGKIPESDASDLSRLLAAAAEVISTFVAPTPGSTSVRAYALIRLSKGVAAFNTESFVLEHRLSVNTSFIDQVATDSANVLSSARRDTKEQRTAAQAGVVYIQIANESDRGIGEAVRANLSEIISAPGVEVRRSQPSNVVRYFSAPDKGLAEGVKNRVQSYLAAEGYPTDLTLENLSGTRINAGSKQIEVWLGDFQKLTPRVYVEQDNGLAPERLQEFRGRLEQIGYEVHVEKPSDVPNQDARVIYYKDSDAIEAEMILKQFPGLGISTTRETPTKIKGPSNARPRHFDLRIGRDTISPLGGDH